MNDKEVSYWAEFYSKFKVSQPSPFCKFIVQYFNKFKPHTVKLIDIGCGNGRDSYQLSKLFNVIGIDSSNVPTSNSPHLSFIKDDFTTTDFTGFHIVYSRFTLHSVPNEMHTKLLQNIQPKQILCIETRSDKGNTTDTHYGNTHYRNLTNKKYITDLLTKFNFNITFIEENKGFAPFKDEDPVCIRIIAVKMK